MAEIEYFYSAHSAYAWLGHDRLREIAAETGRRILHRPVLLNPVIEASGSTLIPTRSEGHRDYFFGREIARWAEERGKPGWVRPMPTHHRADYVFANQVLIAAQDRGEDVDALSGVFLAEHWERDADLSDRATLARLIEATGLSPDGLFAAAEAPEIVAQHEANGEDAIARSVFGSPTYFVDGDMFYGQDRLEMVRRACGRAYAK